MAILAVHLGCVSEEIINEMSILFFEDVLTELGHKLAYDAVVNYAGNAFCEKSWELIQDANPLTTKDARQKGIGSVLELLSKSKIRKGYMGPPKEAAAEEGNEG